MGSDYPSDSQLKRPVLTQILSDLVWIGTVRAQVVGRVG